MRGGLKPPKRKALLLDLLFLLVPNVRFDHLLIISDRTHAIPSGPQVEPTEISLLPKIPTVNLDDRLALDEADRVRNAEFCRNAETQVNVIRHPPQPTQLRACDTASG